MRFLVLTLAVLCHLVVGFAQSATLDLAGLTVTPHVQFAELRYRREPDPSLGARVELFLRHRLLRGETSPRAGPALQPPDSGTGRGQRQEKCVREL